MTRPIQAFTPQELKLLALTEPTLDLPLHIRQTIASRKKIQHKLPTWYAELQIHYPSSISLEQSSSERTAAFKSSLFSGERFIDLTSGFGVDSFFFAKKFQEVISVEQQKELSLLSEYNAKQLGMNHISCVQKDALSFLNTGVKADLIYIDPARRDSQGGKVFRLSDCEPNIVQLLPLIENCSKEWLIKVSPYADIKQLLLELPHVAHVYVVSVENECKEILLHGQPSFDHEARIHAVNLTKSIQRFSFYVSEEKKTESELSWPRRYVYEPHASILKAGAFQLTAKQYSLFKLHKHTHWYTSDEWKEDFPGRCFEVMHTGHVQHKELKACLPEMKAHLLVRNFPDTVAGLRKKLKLNEGGDDYVLVTTNCKEEKLFMLCKRHY